MSVGSIPAVNLQFDAVSIQNKGRHLDEFVRACYTSEPWVLTAKKGIFEWMCPDDNTFHPNLTEPETKELLMRQVDSRSPELFLVLRTASCHCSGSDLSANVRRQTMNFICEIFNTPGTSPDYNPTDVASFRTCIDLFCKLHKSESPLVGTTEVLSNLDTKHPMIGTNALVHALAVVMTRPLVGTSDDDLLSLFANELKDWTTSNSLPPSTRQAVETKANSRRRARSPLPPRRSDTALVPVSPAAVPVSPPPGIVASNPQSAIVPHDAQNGDLTNTPGAQLLTTTPAASPVQVVINFNGGSQGNEIANLPGIGQLVHQGGGTSDSRNRDQGGGNIALPPKRGFIRILTPYGDQEYVRPFYAVFYVFIRAYHLLYHSLATKIIDEFRQKSYEVYKKQIVDATNPISVFPPQVKAQYVVWINVCMVSILVGLGWSASSSNSTGRKFELITLLVCFILTHKSNSELHEAYEEWSTHAETEIDNNWTAADNATEIGLNFAVNNEIKNDADTIRNRLFGGKQTVEELFWSIFGKFSMSTPVFNHVLRAVGEIFTTYVIQLALNNANEILPPRRAQIASGYTDHNQLQEFRLFMVRKFREEPQYLEGAQIMLTAISCDPVWAKRKPSSSEVSSILLPENGLVGPKHVYRASLRRHAEFLLASK